MDGQVKPSEAAETIPVLEITDSDYPDAPIYIDDIDDLQHSLEYLLGDCNEWRDFDGDPTRKVTIRITTMAKKEFDELEPWEY